MNYKRSLIILSASLHTQGEDFGMDADIEGILFEVNATLEDANRKKQKSCASNRSDITMR